MNESAKNPGASREPRFDGDRTSIDKPRQFRLDSLLAGITLAAALFAWVRTWESGTRSVVLGCLALVAAWWLPLWSVRSLIRSRRFRSASYLWTVVASQCWFPAAVLLFVVALRHLDESRRAMFDWANSIYLLASGLTIAFVTALVVGFAVERWFPSRDEERRALLIGGVTTPLLVVIAGCITVDPPDWLFAAVLFVIQALFSYAVFVPFGIIFADRAMCLRRGRPWLNYTDERLATRYAEGKANRPKTTPSVPSSKP